VSNAKDDEFQFEPIEEQPEREPVEGELPPLDEGDLGPADEGDLPPLDEGDLPPLDETPEGPEGVSPADPLAEGADADLAAEMLEEEEEAAFPAGEEISAAAAGEEAEAEDKALDEKKKKKKGGGLVEAVKNASPYTVMLVVAFFALLLGILALFGELALYEYDIKAEKAKRGGALAPALYRSTNSSTLAACPTPEKLNFSAAPGALSSGSPQIT